MNELELSAKMRQQGLNLSTASGTDGKALVLERTLKIVIPPRSSADVSGFRNVCKWLEEEAKAGRFDENVIFRRVLDFALEASGKFCRNPAAVFMSLMKKELKYQPKKGA